MNMYSCIKKIYPTIKDDEFELRDDSDGKGAYIKSWTFDLPQPTQTELKVVYPQVLKEEKIREFKVKAGEEILAKYPFYKQININALQGYTQEDKDAMWLFINKIRDESNNLEAQVNSAATVAEIEKV